MTSDELKESLTMREVIESYGIRVSRSNMCCCPIHGEKHPSMKVYKDSFNCFACGANGDIFTFVQLMDNCDFKTAFISLGGTYENTTNRQKAAATLLRTQNKKQKAEKDKVVEQLKTEMIRSFDWIKYSLQNDIPFNDRWCASHNMLPVLQNWWDLWVSGEEIDVLNVYRECKQFNKRFDSVTRTNAGTISARF